MNKLPNDFIEESSSFFGSDIERETFLLSISDSEPPVSIRLNPEKRTSRFDGYEHVNWCEDGRYLNVRPSFTLDPLFWGGAYYPQEASSMIIGEIVRMISPHRVLDLCAAPGGKTNHISSVISEDALLVSNEVISSRAKTLVENIQRWGMGNVIVTSSQPKNFAKLGGYFDLILTDVPCSGEGMFRKDPTSITEWSLDNVKSCVIRSKSILCDVWNALAEGGYLLFSTCTYNRSEDEEMVSFIENTLGAEYIPLDSLMPDSVDTSGKGYHFFPHKIKGEGFFVALLRKTSGCDFSNTSIKYAAPFKPLSKSEISLVNSYILDQEDLDFRLIGDKCYGFPKPVSSEIDYVRSVTSPLYAGIQFGKIVASKLKPSQSLAYYYKLSSPVVSVLSLEDSLRFLRKDSQSPNLFLPGLSAVKYENVVLGWANRVQGRVNNLYPNDQRIRLSVN